jgi:DNA topoisomerase IA
MLPGRANVVLRQGAQKSLPHIVADRVAGSNVSSTLPAKGQSCCTGQVSCFRVELVVDRASKVRSRDASHDYWTTQKLGENQ